MADETRTRVVVVSGSMGCGKTTVLGEASDVLSIRHIPHACVDLDAIWTVSIAANTATDFVGRNLAGIYANFVRSGLRHLLLAEAVETRGELDELKHAMPGAEVVVCRLVADVRTMEERLRIREPGLKQATFVARARQLQEVLEAAQLEDFTVVNDSRSVTDVAVEVLRRAGWLD